MSIEIMTKEQLQQLLNTWYQSILKQNFVQSKSLKKEIEEKILHVEKDQNVTFYYTLLTFRYQVLVDSLSITSNSFDKIDSLTIPDDALLTHYYHLFKGIHLMYISNYSESKNHFEKLKSYLNMYHMH